jgi:hypothetical protein
MENVRRVNNDNLKQLMSKSMEIDAYHLQKGFQEDPKAYQEHERQKKEHMRQFYHQGMMADAARQEKMRYDRQLDQLIAQKKEQEDREINAKKEDYYAKWRQKHFEEKHPHIQHLIADLNYQKEVEKA